MSDTEDTLRAVHRAILDEPGEDVHRLAFADLLEERGLVYRARFVRDMVAWAHAPKDDALRGRLAPVTDVRPDWLWGCVPLARAAAAVKSLCSVHLRDARATVVTHWWADPVALGWRRGFVGGAMMAQADWFTFGPRLARAHPLEWVELSDREPGAGTPGWFAWWCDVAGTELQPHWIRPGIWRRLRGEQVGEHSACFYPSREEAMADLSRACLSWARP